MWWSECEEGATQMERVGVGESEGARREADTGEKASREEEG